MNVRSARMESLQSKSVSPFGLHFAALRNSTPAVWLLMWLAAEVMKQQNRLCSVFASLWIRWLCHFAYCCFTLFVLHFSIQFSHRIDAWEVDLNIFSSRQRGGQIRAQLQYSTRCNLVPIVNHRPLSHTQSPRERRQTFAAGKRLSIRPTSNHR